MRVSTAQIFDTGARGIGKNQFDLFKVQNQLSTGRKVLAPEDDPIASAQILVLSQSKAVSEQYLTNQDDARSKLGIVDGQLGSLNNLLQNVRERLVQAGNTNLSGADLDYVAEELEARFSELLGIANATDGSGNYLFSGYQGAVKPFSLTSTGASYVGDEGKRLLQVESSRQIQTNVSGSELFLKVKTGNGTFATATAGQRDASGVPLTDAAGNPLQNQGSAQIDQGSVTNLASWNNALDAGYGNAEIRFSIDDTQIPAVTNYEIYDPVSSARLFPLPGDPLPKFTPGQAINLSGLDATPADFGVTVTITGNPANGDSFRLSPSQNQDVFTTLRNTINLLKKGVIPGESGVSPIEFSNQLAGNLQNISQTLENVNRLQSSVGSWLHELDSLTNTGSDLQLQYSESLSNLQDLDYTQAISDLSRKQLQLEAAQKSFRQTSQLSLFNIL